MLWVLWEFGIRVLVRVGYRGRGFVFGFVSKW